MESSQGQLYNPFRAQDDDADGFAMFPDVLGDGDEQHHHDVLDEDPFLVPEESFTRHPSPQQQGWTSAARPLYGDANNKDGTDPWTPPMLVDTSLDTSLEEEDQERVDLLFSSPERNSLFPKVGIMQDFAWSPEGAFSRPHESLARRTEFPGFQTSKNNNNAAVSTASSSVSIVMEERLSILFDGITSEPTCRVIGRINVQKAGAPEMFELVLRDRKGNIEDWDAHAAACMEDSEATSRLGTPEGGEIVFRVDARNIQQAPILEYICVPKLKPIPLLLKSKVHEDENSCKIGIRIRANPNNSHSLRKMAIMVVVPPDLNGYSVQMSRKGGEWNDMKRTLSWTLDQLAPGDSLDIQAVFVNVQNGNRGIERRFPILLQCQGNGLFSKVEIGANAVGVPSERLREPSSRTITMTDTGPHWWKRNNTGTHDPIYFENRFVSAALSNGLQDPE